MAIRLSPYDKLVKARVQLQQKAYFIYSILFYAKYRLAGPEEVALWPYPTACADALGNILVAEEYIAEADNTFVETLLYHEACHLVLLHPTLGRDKIRILFNIACDIKVNQYVKEAGYPIPVGWVAADHFGTYTLKMADGTSIEVKDCKTKSCLDIYEELYRALDLAGKIKKISLKCGFYGDGQSSGGGGGEEPEDDANGECDGLPEQAPNHHGWDDLDGFTIEEVREALRDRVRGAYTSAKARGDMPGGLELRLGEILESKTDWRSLIRRTLTSAMPCNSSYRLPHKRSFALGMYLPHIEKEASDVVISIDSSGSCVGQDEVTAFLSEIVSMARQCHNLNMEVIVCDAAIQDVFTVNDSDVDKIMAIKVTGGGGTSHVPVFDYVRDKYQGNAKLLVCLTDGYTEFPSAKDVAIEVLWVLTEHGIPVGNVPFGQAIKIGTS